MKALIHTLLLALPVGAWAQQLPTYLNPDAPIEERVQDALSRMTLEEKVRLSYAQSKFSSPGVPRLGIAELYTSDGPHGVRMEINWNDWGHARWTNDSITAFPALTCLAATWDPELARLYGLSVGEEARYRRKDVLLGPGVNIYRTPLGGRNFEYMGEDPYLAGAMCVPYIEGLQTNGVSPCLKHYILNDQEEFRGHVDVKVSRRAFHEIYFAPFRRAVEEAGVWSMMGSYNQYHATHCCHNDLTINRLLKQELGWDGAIVSDWGGTHDTRQAALGGLDLEMGSYTNGLTTEATGFSYDDYYLGNAYLQLARQGVIPDSVVNDKAARMLRLHFRTQRSHNTAFPDGCLNTQAHLDADRRIGTEGIVLLKNAAPRPAKGSAEARPLLPIDPTRHKKILIVGDNATRSLTAGGGSSELKPKTEISPLDALRGRLAGGPCAPLFDRHDALSVSYAQGYTCGGAYYGRIDAVPASVSDSLRAEAVGLAREADLVIFVGGLNKNHFQDCEGGDRLTYHLDFHQDELIEALLDVNPNVVCVIVSGNAYAMPWLERVPALVQSWYIGSMAGPALADVLTGDVCPSGKTVFSYPVELDDCPAHQLGRIAYPGVSPADLPADLAPADADPASAVLLARATQAKGKGLKARARTLSPELSVRNVSPDPQSHAGKGDEVELYAEDILVGYRWYDYHGLNGVRVATEGRKASATARVNFPFGYGLSYTTFRYGTPVIVGDEVRVEVTNTGDRAGRETVQFYVGDDKASVIRPRKELKAFTKLTLQPGETQVATYRIRPADLQYFDEASDTWRSEPGRFHIYVASSSADIRGAVTYDLR